MEFSHTWITIPLVGGFIGWITNLIAVRMLFHPRVPVKIGPFSVQGVFPKRQEQLAQKLGELVATELFSGKDAAESIRKAALSEASIDLVLGKIGTALQTRVPAVFPMATMFLTPEVMKSIMEAFRPDVEALLSLLVDKLSGTLEHTVDIREIVREKVSAFSSDKLEEIILGLMKKELVFVEYVGGVLGVLIGIAQVLLTVI
jgi:uncharacterized membrane protein YheB (UPF0754 family)